MNIIVIGQFVIFYTEAIIVEVLSDGSHRVYIEREIIQIGMIGR